MHAGNFGAETPVLALVSPGYRDLLQTARPDHPDVARWRQALADDGCAVVPGFLDADALLRADAECGALIDQAYARERRTNCYDTHDDPTLPADHPARIFMKRTQAFVAADRIPPDFVVQQLYRAPGFRRLVAACLGEPEIHPYDDPFGAIVVNVLKPGATHPWHFDATEFVVSMMTRAARAGGVFEYCPNIRRDGDERHAAVSAVLRGTDRGAVKMLELRPGDLQLFKGRYSLHRVTQVDGDRTRLVAIFSYARIAGVVGKSARARTLFGRVAPEHIEADGSMREDALRD